MKQFLVNISDKDFTQLRKDYVGTMSDEDVVKMLLGFIPNWYVKEMPALNDIMGSELVEIAIREDGEVLWINNEKGCMLRISQIKQLVLDDRREPVGRPEIERPVI
jgi:hypothetical protein